MRNAQDRPSNHDGSYRFRLQGAEFVLIGYDRTETQGPDFYSSQHQLSDREDAHQDQPSYRQPGEALWGQAAGRLAPLQVRGSDHLALNRAPG